MNVNETKTGNFVLPNDVDYYYYKHRQATELLTLFAQPSKPNASLPKRLRGTLVPIISVVEDTNGNMTIDEDEYGKAVTFSRVDGARYMTYTDRSARRKCRIFLCC